MGTETKYWLLVFLFVAVFVSISLLFHSQRAKPPTVFEKIVATSWLLLRRLVCFAGALLFLVGAIALSFNLTDNAIPIDAFTRFGYALFLFAVSAFCVWAAIYGQGQYRGELKDDVALHRENKKRYGWRW